MSNINDILTHFNELKDMSLVIDITRGKPGTSQLDLSNDLLSSRVDPITDDGVDLRNYGEPNGIYEARKLGSELLNAPIENIFAGEQSSLLLTYQTILANFLFAKPTPWKDLKKPTFICPVPGFDRHFMMLNDFGINVETIPLIEDGIDLDAFKDALSIDADILGILCVPRHSNPSGEVYSDENLQEMFKIGKQFSNKFIFLFDHAYLVHDFLPTKEQRPLWEIAQEVDVCEQTVVVTSFSKITFGGGGISFMATDGFSMELIKKVRTTMIICPDKINQKKHVEFLKDVNSIKSHMEKHAELIRPKFELAYSYLDKLGDEYGKFSKPTGGYFIAYNTKKPIADRVVELCKELGVLLTPAGSTFPNGNDPKNSVIRIAPTYVSLKDLTNAMDAFITSVMLAHHEET
tara:strand:- start:682 stop:1896 length:1215 start_codon:yes stop_codon:yes gene_type:complete